MRPSLAVQATTRALALLASLLVRRDLKSLRSLLHEVCRERLRDGPAISYEFVRSLLAGEDHRFFRHLGIDFVSLRHAIRDGIRSGRWRGASTIEQQLVRTLFGRRDRTSRRKAWEILLASHVDRLVEKREVPETYLTVAHFGVGIEGS